MMAHWQCRRLSSEGSWARLPLQHFGVKFRYSIRAIYLSIYLSVEFIYRPFKVTTQKRSQPRSGQKGRSYGDYKTSSKNHVEESAIREEGHSRQRDQPSRRPYSVQWPCKNVVSNSHHERSSEAIADPDRTKIGQKAPKDKQEQRQGYNAKQLQKPYKGYAGGLDANEGYPASMCKRSHVTFSLKYKTMSYRAYE